MVKVQIKQGDVVVVSMPFLETTGEKIRPAIVFSNNNSIAKSPVVLLIPITTNLRESSFTYLLNREEQTFANLHDRSLLWVDRITALNQSLIIKKIGSVPKKTFQNVKKIFMSQI